MNAHRRGMGWILALLVGAAWASGLIALPAGAQRARTESRYEYRVVTFHYNPGERLTDEARAKQFERVLNEYAGEGWEPVTDLLSRSTVHTVGGAVTTRDTVGFVAFRRPR